MDRPYVLLLLVIGFLTTATAQKKTVSVEEIYGGEFRTEGLDVLRSLNNGKEYTVLNYDRSNGNTSIDKYDYDTLEKTGTIISSADLPEIQGFSSYEFSSDESKILLATQVEPIFRRSTLGVFYLYEIATKSLIQIADTKIQEPLLSPNGSQVAYVAENNLYPCCG